MTATTSQPRPVLQPPTRTPARTKVCFRCNIEPPATKRSRYCARCKETPYVRPCHICRKPVEAKNRCNGPNRTVCGQTCQHAATKLRNGPKTCQWCNAGFWSKSPTAEFCSPLCSNRKRANTLVDFTCPACKMTSKQKQMGAENPRVVCAQCATDRRSKSKRKGALSRSRRTFTLADVIARHDATCHLCELPIDTTITGQQPFSASINKLVPTSDGGPDTLDNARPAHLKCAGRRGNKPLDALTPDDYRQPPTADTLRQRNRKRPPTKYCHECGIRYARSGPTKFCSNKCRYKAKYLRTQQAA